MKFASATLTAPVILKDWEDSARKLEFPAGTAVTVALFNEEPDPTRYHLNAAGPGGQWDTYEGYAPAAAVQVGEIIATANEG